MLYLCQQKLLDEGSGKVGVLNCKQGFIYCEKFVKLEKWLAESFTKYWETFDTLQLVSHDTLTLMVERIINR